MHAVSLKIGAAMLFGLTVGATAAAQTADNYPNRSITMVVAFTSGILDGVSMIVLTTSIVIPMVEKAGLDLVEAQRPRTVAVDPDGWARRDPLEQLARFS